MHNSNNDLIESITSSKGNDLLLLLDDVKNQIADARLGDYSTESRKLAIEVLDKVLYNKVKALLKPQKKTESFIAGML